MKLKLPLICIIILMIVSTGCYEEPDASFTISDKQVMVGEEVTFTNASGSMERCEWLFGDGGQSTEISPTHIYQEPGTYNVVLRVFGKKDIKADIATGTVTVDVLKPVASFSVSASEIVLGNSVSFTNNSQNMSRCEWDFGDGTESTAINTVHTYTQTGSYDVNLRVYSLNDVKYDVAVITVIVTYTQPVASFTVSASEILPGESVTFTNTSQYWERCEWDFGDGTQSTATSPTHAFAATGSYDVNLKVYSKQDLKFDLEVITIEVTYKQPVASFSVSSSSILPGESVKFTNTSQYWERCEWVFGDGATSTETSPSHTFTTEGTYSVNLKVYSKEDLKFDSEVKTITVLQPTILWINIKNFDGDAITNCSVTLYKTYDDWYNGTNVVYSATTNTYGRAIIEDVESGLYYINAYKKIDDTYFYCNWFIQYSANTYKTVVIANKINELTIKVYYSTITKKAAVEMME